MTEAMRVSPGERGFPRPDTVDFGLTDEVFVAEGTHTQESKLRELWQGALEELVFLKRGPVPTCVVGYVNSAGEAKFGRGSQRRCRCETAGIA